MKRNILLLTLLIAAATLIAPVMAPVPPVEISKIPYCWNDPEDVLWSDNPEYWIDDTPFYYVGTKYYWWIRIQVHANEDLENVRVYDRLGAELMIEGISIEDPKIDPYDYDFSYPRYPMLYRKDGPVVVTHTPSGRSIRSILNKPRWGGGVKFGLTPYRFDIYWTGESVKVHFMWSIGSMSEGETLTIFLTVSTDKNPAMHQEYTSEGCYELNSGATVKAIRASNGKQFSETAPQIRFRVAYPPED